MDALGALVPLMEDAEDGRFIGTYDYSLAFDYTNPRIAIAIFKWLGMPEGTAEVIASVWTRQVRILQYAGEANPMPHTVTTSLPQG